MPALITYAQSVVTAMTGNPSFPSPVPALALVTAGMTALHDAESAALARTKGAVAARNDKRLALVTLLQEVRNYVQSVADTDLETAATVIQSAGGAYEWQYSTDGGKTWVMAPSTLQAKTTVTGLPPAP
ncbi:MAG TPA: hypothetical protein VF765_13990 [Polyangiaceae bacterium]